MPAAPAKTEISDTYPNPSNAVARTGFGKLWDWATTLLGTSGTQADAQTALGLKIGFVYSFNNTFGFIKFPDWLGGWIVQWDNITMSGSGGVAAVLPITFPTRALGAVVTPKAAGFFVAIPAHQISTTTITAFICNASGTGVAGAQAFYIAVGN
jgi:hypothetical protein